MELQQDSDNNVGYEALELFQPPTAHRDTFQKALDRALDKVTTLVPYFGLRNPRMGIPGTNRYAFCIPDEWVASFWPGQIWLTYSLTGDPRLKNSARMRREYFRTVLEHPRWHDHDLGFLFSLTAVADYTLLFRTLFQQVFLNSKHANCELIYRFETGIGLKWEDIYGRRFLATAGQSAWSTNTG